MRVKNRENERDKLTKKEKRKKDGRRSRKTEYELFFKRQTLLLDLSPRIKVKSKKKKNAEGKCERESD